MLCHSLRCLDRIGFYVAQHPWLKAAGFVKVGFTTCLEARLDMASFKTCFTPEWYYTSVFECHSAADALLLEQSILFCFSAKRVTHRELLNVHEDEVTRMAATLVKHLCIEAVERRMPTYPPASKGKSLSHPDSSTKEGMLTAVEGPARHSSETLMTVESPSIQAKAASIAPHLPLLNSIVRDSTPSASPPEIFMSDPDAEDLCSGDFQFLSNLLSEEDYRVDTLRPYQLKAVQRICDALCTDGKAICQMACRCGKTPVAHRIIQEVLQQRGNGRVLYLVPGLSLLRQTAMKLFRYGLFDVPLVLVGSDPSPVVLDDTTTLFMTTNLDFLTEMVLKNEKVVVVSTYNSSPLLQSLNIFELTVFDECHRVCGSANITAFNTILKLPSPHGKRLFLTATPTYDTPVKMSDASLFGGIAYRYYLREGINAGYVNSFAVRVVLGDSFDDMTPYFFEAMRLADKMLVFCRNIKHAEEMYEQLMKTTTPEGVPPFTVFIAHSRMGTAAVARVLSSFAAGKRCILFNVRLFQEGVEIPDLNAVFFAAPRYSSRDIIQSICRPLNKLEGKLESYVFLPAVYHAEHAVDDPINLQSFSTLIPFTDALMNEDPTLFEYMIDPNKKEYNLDVIGLRSLKLTSEHVHQFVLPAIRRGVRYSTRNTDRLHRATRLPWQRAFGELQRIVLECNRYPKTNDAWVIGDTSISMNLFYQYVRKGYRLYLDGQETYLQLHQLCDLESLPHWKQYGVHGPYPWKECIQTLESHLAVHGNVPPLDIHRGGYIGLDATPFERLSGCLMHVNQCDGSQGNRLAPERQADMDRICSQYNLRWRKRRTKSGSIVRNDATMVTESYNAFKRLFSKVESLPQFRDYVELHYPGYPEKHKRMEMLQNLTEGKVPPRLPYRRYRKEQGKTSNSGKTASAAAAEQKVMCRICREHISASEWVAHLQSEVHLNAQNAVTFV